MANNDRQVFGYTPQGTPIYDPVGANMGSPSSVMPAAQSMPDAMNTPWQTQSPLGGSPPGGPTNPTNVGAGGGSNALGISNTMNDLYANNTDALAMRYTTNAGQGMGSGSLGLNTDYANNLPYVYMMLQGNNAMNPANAPGSDAYFNWSKNYMDAGNTPNGGAISPQQVMASLYTKDPRNPIYQAIYENGTATPDKIVSNFVNFMQAGMAHQVPPFVLQAMTNMYKQYGAMWIDAKSQGYGGDFTDYLISQGLDPSSLGMQ